MQFPGLVNIIITAVSMVCMPVRQSQTNCSHPLTVPVSAIRTHQKTCSSDLHSQWQWQDEVTGWSDRMKWQDEVTGWRWSHAGRRTVMVYFIDHDFNKYCLYLPGTFPNNADALRLCLQQILFTFTWYLHPINTDALRPCLQYVLFTCIWYLNPINADALRPCLQQVLFTCTRYLPK